MQGRIRLERDPGQPGRDRLVGLNGQVELDTYIVSSVLGSKRLFSHVVGHIALNRVKQLQPDFSYDPRRPATEPLLSTMGQVRDELLSLMAQGMVE